MREEKATQSPQAGINPACIVAISEERSVIMQEKTCLLALGSSLEWSLHAVRIRAEGTASHPAPLPFCTVLCSRITQL